MKSPLSRWPLVLAVLSALAAAPAGAQDAAEQPAPAAAPTEVAEPAPAAADAPAPAADYDYAADTDPSAVDEFRDELAPHGTWLVDDRYGYVWVPNTVVVGRDFVPYRTAGHWAVAEDGNWVFLSDYDWGYIPFHYGRWAWLPARGWAWIPGRVWAPAWVVWRVGDPGYDYVGWGPMPPSYYWVDGTAVAIAWALTVPWWFCSSAYFFHPHWHSHIVHDHVHVQRIVGHTHVHHHHGHQHAKGHAYAAGHASAGGGVDTKAGSGRMHIGGAPTSPSFDAAHIKKAAIPKQRVAHDSRALAMRMPAGAARRSSVPRTRAAVERVAPSRSVSPSEGSRSLGAGNHRSAPVVRQVVTPRGERAPVARQEGPAPSQRSTVVPRRTHVAPGQSRPAWGGYERRPVESHGAPHGYSRQAGPSHEVRSRPAMAPSSQGRRAAPYASSPSRGAPHASSPSRSTSSSRATSPSRAPSRSSSKGQSSRSDGSRER